MTIEFSRDGDQFTTVTQRGQEAPEKLTFKLGAPFTSKSHGLDLEVTSVLSQGMTVWLVFWGGGGLLLLFLFVCLFVCLF